MDNLLVQFKQMNKERGAGSSSFDANGEERAEEILPNGYKRGEYYEQGFSDFDIDFWRLDQIGAPSPQAAGWVLTDLMDGDLDGEIDF